MQVYVKREEHQEKIIVMPASRPIVIRLNALDVTINKYKEVIQLLSVFYMPADNDKEERVSAVAYLAANLEECEIEMGISKSGGEWKPIYRISLDRALSLPINTLREEVKEKAGAGQ